MADVLIRASEGCDPDAFLLWDSVWDPIRGFADWALAGAGESQNAGGLRSTAGIETAITLLLFTDRRMPKDHALAWLADGDPRGWWGDGADVQQDVGEGELGSLLWVLERAPLTIKGQSATFWAEHLALEALAPLQGQGAVVRIDAQAAVNELRNRLELAVQVYGRDGQRIYDRRFDLLWQQVAR